MCGGIYDIVVFLDFVVFGGVFVLEGGVTWSVSDSMKD